jgi:hypothetical protein
VWNLVRGSEGLFKSRGPWTGEQVLLCVEHLLWGVQVNFLPSLLPDASHPGN